MYLHTWMNSYFIEGHLNGVSQEYPKLELLMTYVMSMWKGFSHDLGWWTLFYDLWSKHIGSHILKSNFIKNVNKGF